MLWSEMTEEEIKQNVGKILEEYPKKVTTSESDMKKAGKILEKLYKNKQKEEK